MARHPPEHSRGGGIPAVEAGVIPVVEVHEGAKRPWMWIIPDSLWKSLVVGRVVASAQSTDAGRRSPSPTRRHPTEAGRRAIPAWPRAPKPSRWGDQRPRSWSPRLGASPSPRRARPGAPPSPLLNAWTIAATPPRRRPRHSSTRRTRANRKISGPAADHHARARPPAPAAHARRAPPARRPPCWHPAQVTSVVLFNIGPVTPFTGLFKKPSPVPSRKRHYGTGTKVE